ncbi:MAG: acetyl-CoA carboxylase, carboxyltransferase subunit beta [Rhodospirillales bacterium]
MNWLKDWIRPKLRELVGGQKEIPENLWHKCTSCDAMIFHRDLTQNLHVCPHCSFHMRINAEERLKMLFDDGAFETIEITAAVVDPLKFRDQRKYAERLKQAQNKRGKTDALAVASGKIGGMESVVAALDFEFMGGSMGITVGDGILDAARLAVKKEAPLIVVSSSGGARMQEGILSLMQLPRTTLAVEDVKSAGLPYIVVLADPTTGGVTASFAMLGDIAIAEQGAVIGFAGARVIEQTIRETLPEGFQRAEYLLEHGMVDMVVHRKDLRDTLIRVLDLLLRRGPVAASSAAVSPTAAHTPAQLMPPSTD